MMGRFVDQQAAAVLLFAMPAPEIIRAVTGIQQPRKIDRQRTPDRALHDQFAQRV